jgi:hydroxymethylpyrimidine pyrophosphatase-like HAD family hydrolase
MAFIAFDVDGTLIDKDDEPRHKVIDLYRAFQALGHDMVIWSGGGIGYAELWKHRLGLQGATLPKFVTAVDIAVDDMADGIDTTKQLNAKVILKV